jgi:hypothetical protein
VAREGGGGLLGKCLLNIPYGFPAVFVQHVIINSGNLERV